MHSLTPPFSLPPSHFQTAWLFVQEGGKTQVFTSGDDGTTWGAPRSLKSFNATLPFPMKSPRPSVGHGIQLSGSSGRLVVPMVCVNASAAGSHGDRGCTTCNACLLYSDDHGKSWEWGGIGQQGSREAALVETNGEGLYVSERNMGAAPGHRLAARSSDGGATLGDFTVDASLPTPVTAHWTGIVAGLVRANAKTLVYSAPENPSARKGLALRTSSDDGATWSASRTLWAGPSAYSDLASIDDKTVAIIYENGDVTFADRVSVSIVPVAWIAGGGGGGGGQLAPADAVRLVADYIINDTATYHEFGETWGYGQSIILDAMLLAAEFVPGMDHTMAWVNPVLDRYLTTKGQCGTCPSQTVAQCPPPPASSLTVRAPMPNASHLLSLPLLSLIRYGLCTCDNVTTRRVFKILFRQLTTSRMESQSTLRGLATRWATRSAFLATRTCTATCTTRVHRHRRRRRGTTPLLISTSHGAP